MTITPLEPGNRIQLPAEWTEALGLYDHVALEKTADGILVRSCRSATWDEIFATKLAIGAAALDPQKDAVEMTGDDFLF